MTDTKTQAITPFAPENLEQALRLCEVLSKSNLIPSTLRGKAADIFVVLAAGRELGIGPMQSLQDINVIQGKPVYGADLMVSLCKRHSEVCKFFRLVESTDAIATYETQRAGSDKVERMSFTIEDAKKLGLSGKDNWTKQPKNMLRKRAAAALARDVYPDLVRGYDPDEAEDFSGKTYATASEAPALPPLPVPEDKVQTAAEKIVEQVTSPETEQAVLVPEDHKPSQVGKAKPKYVVALYNRILQQQAPKGPDGTHTKDQKAYATKLMGDAAAMFKQTNKPSAEWSEADTKVLEKHFFGNEPPSAVEDGVPF